MFSIGTFLQKAFVPQDTVRWHRFVLRSYFLFAEGILAGGTSSLQKATLFSTRIFCRRCLFPECAVSWDFQDLTFKEYYPSRKTNVFPLGTFLHKMRKILFSRGGIT